MPNVRKASRGWCWCIAVVGFAMSVYIGSYLHLSRRGMEEAERLGMPYFFYCPLADLVPYQDLPLQHSWAVFVFDPINQIDRMWFGGSTPCHGVTWGFSGPSQ